MFSVELWHKQLFWPRGGKFNRVWSNHFDITKIMTSYQLHSSRKFFTICLDLSGRVYVYNVSSALNFNKQPKCYVSCIKSFKNVSEHCFHQHRAVGRRTLTLWKFVTEASIVATWVFG